MSVTFSDLPAPLSDALCQQSELMFAQMNAAELTKSLFALKKLGLKWSTVNDSFKQQVSKAIKKAFNSQSKHNPQGHLDISNILNALGGCGAVWSELSGSTRNILRDAVIRYGPLESQSMSMALSGLARMQAQWQSMDPQLTTALTSQLARSQVFSDSEPEAIANTIYNLGYMHALWDFLPMHNIETAIAKNIRHFNSQGVSSTLFGLANTQAAWKKLSDRTQREVASAVVRTTGIMTEQVPVTLHLMTHV